MLICSLINSAISSQSVKINEVAASNNSFQDEDGETKDWIELYNPMNTTISMKGWSITDDNNKPQKWVFPDKQLSPAERIVLFASDKNRVDLPVNFRTVLKQGDACKYILPDATTDANWRSNNFNDAQWLDGITGLGYGDNDDATIVPEGTPTIFVRQKFQLTDPSIIDQIIFHLDYDDGFVAYLNGKEIARSNVLSMDTYPPFDTKAVDDREATLKYEGKVEKYERPNEDILVSGENVLAIQVHNLSATSSDLSIIPFLSLSSASSDIPGSIPIPLLALNDTYLHINFKISAEETLYLYDASQSLVDSLTIPALRSDVTIGSSPDGSPTRKIFAQPSPKLPNGHEVFEGILQETVTFSQAGGIYDSDLDLMLSGASAGTIIRYTVDGSTPIATSAAYTSPIIIDKNTIVKARLFKAGYLPSPPVSNSYLVKVNHDLPIISLSFNPEDFFDEKEGIYSFGTDFEAERPFFGANFWKDVEKPIHLDFYEKDGKKGFGANAGVKIYGSYSRELSQRSLAIFFRSQYGENKLDYPLFDNRPYSSFESFILRSSGQDWQLSMIRDLTATGLFRNSNLDIQAGRPVASYLNGTYWGLYNIREKINEHFLADLHNVRTKDITILELDGEAVYGNNEAYLSLRTFMSQNDLRQDQNYQQVMEQIDIDNYIQYNIANIYIAN